MAPKAREHAVPEINSSYLYAQGHTVGSVVELPRLFSDRAARTAGVIADLFVE